MVSGAFLAMAGGGAEISARDYRDTVLAAACLGLVWLGDALIYVVLPLGGWIVTRIGPQGVFVVYGLVGLLAVPLALSLPRLRQTVADTQTAAKGRWVPSPLNIMFFVVALGADGVFTATLSTLLADL